MVLLGKVRYFCIQKVYYHHDPLPVKPKSAVQLCVIKNVQGIQPVPKNTLPSNGIDLSVHHTPHTNHMSSHFEYMTQSRNT